MSRHRQQLVIAEYDRSAPNISTFSDGSYAHITHYNSGLYDCEVSVIRDGKRTAKMSYQRNNLIHHLRKLRELKDGGLSLKKILISEKHYRDVHYTIAALKDEMVVDVEKLPRM